MKWEKKNYQHFLITRFNVKINSMKPKKMEEKNICIDQDYLQERFEIFEEFTIPSVLNQTSKNFEWIVMFSADTPTKFKKKINQMKEKKIFSPLFISDNDDQKKILNEYMLQTKTKGYVISRIDNDDALHKDYIKEVQNSISKYEEEEFILSFPTGIQYELDKNIASKYNFPTNHFVSLCQVYKNKYLKNIFDYNHMELEKNFNVKYDLPNKLMWFEIVHSTNITNRMHMKIKNVIKDKNIISDYGNKNRKLSRKNIIISYLYAIFNIPINIIRLIKMYGVKKIINKIKIKIKGEQ